MYTANKLHALRAVFEYNSQVNCKAYRLITKAIKVFAGDQPLDANLVASLNLHISKYKHLGTEEFVARVG